MFQSASNFKIFFDCQNAEINRYSTRGQHWPTIILPLIKLSRMFTPSSVSLSSQSHCTACLISINDIKIHKTVVSEWYWYRTSNICISAVIWTIGDKRATTTPTSDMPNLRPLIYNITVAATWHQACVKCKLALHSLAANLLAVKQQCSSLQTDVNEDEGC